MIAYTRGDVSRICKVSRARLRYWERTALLEPSDRLESRPVFGFRDLVSVKTVVELLERGVPLRRIRRSVEAVRERIPELDRPLGALRVWAEGSERVVIRHDGVLLEPEGQMVLDFPRPARAVSGVAALAPRRAVPVGAGAHQTALKWFDRGCRLDSDRSTYTEAIEAYLRAVEADPEFADAHCNLGSVYFSRDRRAEARRCFERSIELEPHHVEANLNLAMLLEEEGHNKLALRHYKVALAAEPLCADSRVSIALLYEKLGLPRKAREHWRCYLQLEPAGAWADIARSRLSD